MSIGQSTLFFLECFLPSSEEAVTIHLVPCRPLAGPGHRHSVGAGLQEVPLPWQMDQTVCRMHTEPSCVCSVRFPLFLCSVSKAQRQRKGLHWALLQPPPGSVNTQGENNNKLKKGKTE